MAVINNEIVAGSDVRLRARDLKNLKGTALTVADITSVTVAVFSEDWETAILVATAMTYDAGLDDWGYVWNSPGPAGALYQVQVHVVATDGTDFTRDRTLLLQTDRGA